MQTDPAPLPKHIDADLTPLRAGTASAESDDSRRAQEAFAAAGRTADTGDEVKAVEEYLKAANLAEAAREWYLAAVACERVGEFLFDAKPPHDPERSLRLTRRAVAAYEECGLFDDARRLEYRVTWRKLRHGRALNLPLWVRAELAFSWATAGFGFRPLRAVATAVLLVFAFATIYWATDGVEFTNPGDDEGRRAGTFSECVYFSGTTFATINYGDFIPRPHMRFAALAEGALGIFTMGYFAVVMSNRLRH